MVMSRSSRSDAYRTGRCGRSSLSSAPTPRELVGVKLPPDGFSMAPRRSMSRQFVLTVSIGGCLEHRRGQCTAEEVTSPETRVTSSLTPIAGKYL